MALRHSAPILLLGVLPLCALAQAPPPQALHAGDPRGTTVCRDSADGSLRYRGAVAGFERGKVQVQVSSATSTTDGQPAAGFHATHVWDDPGNWTLCE